MQYSAGSLACRLSWQPLRVKQNSWHIARACEVLYARKLAAELGFCQLTPTRIYEDNEGAIVFVENMHLRNRSKHIALRFSFAKTLYDLGQIKPVSVPSKDQHADIGTKAVGAQILNHHLPVWLGEKL